MTQYDFEKLLEKYLRNECTAEEELLLDEWAIRQIATKTVNAPGDELTQMKKRFWKRIQKSTAPKPKTFFLSWLTWTKLSIAASIIFVLAWFGKYLLTSDSGTSSAQDLLKKDMQMVSTQESSQKLPLSDGTMILLQPHSSITFPEKFGQNDRIVYLNGEALFEVKPDTSRPFKVFAGNLVTEVLGTSFTIKSFQNELTSEVLVWSGKVLVYNALPENRATSSPNDEKKVSLQTILTPNQKVVFEKVNEAFKVELVEKPKQLNTVQTPGSFEFHEDPLFDVLDKLKLIYGIEIEASMNLKDCTFTGDLNGFELYNQLDWICKSIHAKYEIQGAKIVITGSGCL